MSEVKKRLNIENYEASYSFISEKFTSLCDLVSVYVRASCGGRARVEIISLSSNGEADLVYGESYGGEISLKYSFDPISLAVYGGAESFFVRIEADGKILINELSVTESYPEISEEEMNARDNTGIGVSGEPVAYVYGEDGEKTEVPRVPKKVLFIGNSLVFGMGKKYGMCASSPDKDYFHYVSEYIRKHNPVCVFGKLYGSMFEHSESLEDFEYWYGEDCRVSESRKIPAKDSFALDTDLIFIQLGDNVNTDEKEQNFKKTGDMLIRRIKNACPNARIIWLYGWYNRKRCEPTILELCEKWRLERIDIGRLRSASTEAHSQKQYYDVYTGVWKEVSERWITHPGDLGMKKIADKVIEKLKL